MKSADYLLTKNRTTDNKHTDVTQGMTPYTLSPRVVYFNIFPGGIFFYYCMLHYRDNTTCLMIRGAAVSNAHSEISRKSDHVFKQTKVGSKVQYFSYKLTYLFFDIVTLSFNTFFPM